MSDPTSPPTEPGADSVREGLRQRDDLLADAAERARRYLGTLGTRSVAPSTRALDELTRLEHPLPEHGSTPGAVLEQLDRIGSPATVAQAGPRYFGFVTGGTHPAALAAAWLANAWDQNNALYAMSPVGNALDRIAIDWVIDALGLPNGTGGAFVTGATMASATALAAARDHVLTEAGWDAHADGLIGAPAVQVITGAEAHTTVSKALGIVGLGRSRARLLPTDDQGRIVARNLPDIDGPTVVILQAGNVNSGCSDPFPELIEWAHAAGAWVHVDGAFGLWAAASPARRRFVVGVDQADSWATDGHKWLNVSYDCGIALVRDAADLRAAARSDAPYLVTEESVREPMHLSPQSSQRARGIEVWAVLAALGRQGLAELVDRTCDHAQRFAAGLDDAGFSVLNDVELNQVVVDFGPATDEIVAAVQAEGTCWAGPTTWRGRRAMRLSVSCWATMSSDVERSLATIVSIAQAHTSREERQP